MNQQPNTSDHNDKSMADSTTSNVLSSPVKRARYDCYGNRIIKGFKCHHIKFNDE